jgi:Protein of unknown function (DUF2878)
MNNLINFILMQLGWFAAILGAAHHQAWIGSAAAVAIVMQHCFRAEQPLLELKLIAIAFGVGFVLDSALSSAGLIEFTSGVLVPGLTAHWMLGLWVVFATAMTTSLQWLMKRPLWAMLFGAVGGPLAYFSGAKLGAIQITSELAYVVIAVGWAAAMALFSAVIQRLSVNEPRVTQPC